MLRSRTNPMRAVSAGDVDDDTPVLVSLDHRITTLEKSADKQAKFAYWLAGLMFTAVLGIGGLAYNAHSQLADRLIEVTHMTREQLARVEERMKSLERHLEQRP